MAKKLICPDCDTEVPYMVVRSSFSIKEGKPVYQNGSTYCCPWCGHGLASSEERAIERLTKGE